MKEEPEDRDDSSRGLFGKASAVTSRFVRPARAVARSGREVLNDEAERAIDGIMASSLPEAVGRSLIEHRVLERVVAEAAETKAVEGPALDQEQIEQLVRRTLENPALERALTSAIDSKATTEFVERLVQSPAFKRALKDVLSSPEVRAALMQQTTSFAGEIADAARGRAKAVDNKTARDVPFGGFATRGIALVADALVINLVFLLAGALVGLIGGMFGELRPQWIVGAIAGLGWAIIVGGYFVVLWSTAGQTLGGRLMHVRVVHGDAPPSLWRSVVRLVGLGLAIVPCFAGFLPVLFDAKRRALQDYLAGTVVVYTDEEGSV